MKKVDLDITKLKKCLDPLKNCTKDYLVCSDKKMREYIEDACVKRFEYTVETAWKIMKKYLKLEYGKSDTELTMNKIFRCMEGYYFITSWEKWREYYEKRNSTSHDYNKIKAQDLLKLIDSLVTDTQYLYDKLSAKIED